MNALARQVAAEFARLEAELAAAARRVRARDDREAAHDLRVASRRLASALDVWAGLLHARRAERLHKRLRQLRRGAGPLRDAEVTRDMLMKLSSGLPHYSRLAAEDLAHRIERRIARHAAPAARAARKVRVKKVARALERSMESSVRSVAAGAARADALSRVAQLERSARGALVSAIRDRKDDAFHAARIAVKRWRYGLESLRAMDREGGAAAARRAPALVEMRAIQRALGTLHDLESLRAIIQKRVQTLESDDRRAEAEALHEALPVIEREREAPLAELQGLVTTRRVVSRRRAG